MQSINEFFPLLSVPKKIVVTMHQKPDGDAMGSALGIYHYLKALNHNVTVISPTNWADFLDWMPSVGETINFESHKEKSLAVLANAEIIICLDFNIFHRTKHLAQHLANSSAIKVLIDHHEQPDTASFQFGISDTGKSSTCEMVYDFIVASGGMHLINQAIATCLYTGVMTDTGSFRFPSTKASVHLMVAALKSTGFDHSMVHGQIYDQSLENRLRFIGFALLNRMEVWYEYNAALMYISQQDLNKYSIKTGDTEGLVNYLLSIKGIRFGAIVIDRTEERKWSFRSKGSFDVNLFARMHFEGGGHANAAGGRSSDSLDKTIQHFKQIIPLYKNQLQ
ncbi:MAG: bifunctional oligoribonuclease/PAP phosphatase NrnA [Sphingobacteriia bacterium]|nr:MAG: bifunctional oligoribonuclease/PAP phosphatase NrnA [Sphingobacteriia bacterium]TAG29743.1 MAG: bifunctional oligoribonuclease/PAP phosphatase NrnA [Sphingobacteriia bacterium]TAH06475.1 MAG: bifunctional oligoribonuclease/PAP phosphatase NrnA [Sphingobacteriia bacterium]